MKNTPDLAKSAQKRSPRHALVRKSGSFVHSSTAAPLFGCCQHADAPSNVFRGMWSCKLNSPTGVKLMATVQCTHCCHVLSRRTEFSDHPPTVYTYSCLVHPILPCTQKFYRNHMSKTSEKHPFLTDETSITRERKRERRERNREQKREPCTSP